MAKETKILQEKNKDPAIKKEIQKLKKIFVKIDKNNQDFIISLIERAAFLKINLERMENDLRENGWVEDFTQSENCEPYARERPIARIFASNSKNYQSVMKQLSEYLNKDEGGALSEQSNFFLNGIRRKELAAKK